MDKIKFTLGKFSFPSFFCNQLYQLMAVLLLIEILLIKLLTHFFRNRMVQTRIMCCSVYFLIRFISLRWITGLNVFNLFLLNGLKKLNHFQCFKWHCLMRQSQMYLLLFRPYAEYTIFHVYDILQSRISNNRQ
jgi:hypothetical protein